MVALCKVHRPQMVMMVKNVDVWVPPPYSECSIQQGTHAIKGVPLLIHVLSHWRHTHLGCPERLI